MTNHDEAFPDERDNRRFLTILASSKNKQDTDYFERAWGLLEDENAMKSIYDFLMTRNPPQKFVFREIPESDYQMYLRSFSESLEKRFLKHYILVESGVTSVSNKNLHLSFQEFCKEEKLVYEKSYRRFSSQMYRLIAEENLSSGIRCKGKTNQGVVFGINVPELRRLLYPCYVEGV